MQTAPTYEVEAPLPFDARAQTIDNVAGIEAVRAAWGGRVAGFEMLYREHGEITNDTDASVAVTLSRDLRAAVTASVVGHFRREIGMRRYERSAKPEHPTQAVDVCATAEVATSPTSFENAHVVLAQAAIHGLCARIELRPDFAAHAVAIGRAAALIASEALSSMREARP